MHSIRIGTVVLLLGWLVVKRAKTQILPRFCVASLSSELISAPLKKVVLSKKYLR